uniref:Putative teneurin-1 n=2 Tax=Anopheles triannulatus TaxID=58253 RepID=A0A2M4AJI3_9DIPT
MFYLKIIFAGILLMVVLCCSGIDGSCSTKKAEIGYQMKNGKKVATIKIPCCKGYIRLKTRQCQPICSQPCENSDCTAPNVCTCHAGYKKLSNYRCIPHCDGCDNGVCTKPGYCQCLSGYIKSDNGTCVAECNNCSNGFCQFPNECECHAGYELVGDAATGYQCQPVCSGGCSNGQCVAPGECVCNEGFSMSTTGECVPIPRCPEGYEEFKVDDAATVQCRPICSEPCQQGECVAPEQCECFQGYSNVNSSSTYQCLPVCNGGCINGDCIAPGQCVCRPQYGKIGEECVPLCEKCSLGHCVRPNECVCDRGYRLTNGDCEPICEMECINAICTGPNACTCLPGYNYTDINALFDCLPVCDEECINGRCVAPQTCECDEGYVRDDENMCVHPVELCRQKCANGHCRGAECYCNAGYVKSATDGHCERTCPNGCSNGDCRGGACFCHEGYQLHQDNESICEPVCGEDYDYSSTGCINGRCIRPNVCECDDGYEFVDVNQTRCESSEELARQRAAQERAAQCQRSCRNGKCRAGECWCDEGYARPEGDGFICKPVCDEPCRNGTCVLPNRCECNAGFVFVNGSNSLCRSEEDLRREANERCTALCQNGDCYGGDRCICMIGYRAPEADPFNCQAVCGRSCENGYCIGNDRCRCLEGFSMSTEDDHLCNPICTPQCVYGTCVAPEKCLCDPGYIGDENRKNVCRKQETIEERMARELQIECERECRNGKCEQGECRCDEGFRHSPGNLQHCEPFCEQNCESGRCIGNNRCECFEQYELVEPFVCAPICETDCLNGFCSAPNHCQCHEGYRKSNESDSECRPVCGDTDCTNGVCVAPNECSCLDGYYPDEDNMFLCLLDAKAILLPREGSERDYYKMSYMHYFIPVIACVSLILAILIIKMIVRNRQKNYHVGKLGNVRQRSCRNAASRTSNTAHYNDYNLVVLFPTESKENCVYFMPNPDSKTDELTKLNLPVETI